MFLANGNKSFYMLAKDEARAPGLQGDAADLVRSPASRPGADRGGDYRGYHGDDYDTRRERVQRDFFCFTAWSFATFSFR